MVANWERQWEFEFTEESLAEEIAQAQFAAISSEEAGPCAKSVEYNADKDLIEIHLTKWLNFFCTSSFASGFR